MLIFIKQVININQLPLLHSALLNISRTRKLFVQDKKYDRGFIANIDTSIMYILDIACAKQCRRQVNDTTTDGLS